jgi:chaperone modulatory protein CbpM
MGDTKHALPPVEVIDRTTIFTLAELCRACGVEAEFIEALVDEGILEPAGRQGRHWCFPAGSLQRTRITLHLQRELGVNFAGAALALDLLDRIEKLEARLWALRGGSARWT